MRTLWILLLFPSLALASTAKLDVVQGTVEVGRNGTFQSAQAGAPLETGDSIRTGDASLAVVLFEDGSRLKLNASSTITLSQEEKEHREVSLQAGGVYAQIKKHAQSANKTPFFRLRAKAVTMGVRGTQFFSAFGKEAKSEEQKDAGSDLWMCVQEGVVAVAVEDKPSKKETLVHPGEGVYVRGSTDITPPKAYSWTKSLNWKMDARQGDLVDHSKIEENYRDLLRQNYD